MKCIKIFAPATIANLGSGFDLLGLAIDGIGDEIILHQRDSKEVKIIRIEGADLPYENNKNIVGYLAEMMLKDAHADFGVHIELFKGIKPGSGIGSSAASAVAIVYGINILLANKFSNEELIEYAMEGELLVSGEKFADNVAPCLMGGLVLVNSYDPIKYIQLPVPKGIYAVVLHPLIEVKTSEARAILPAKTYMKDAINQAKSLATLIAGLYTEDKDKISMGLHDYLATPYRKKLIPHFNELKEIGQKHDTLGGGISGSGPSVFHLCDGKAKAEELVAALNEFYAEKNITYNIYVSAVSKQGAREIIE